MSSNVYFVTGASRGIGLELTRQLLEDYNGKVIAGARDPNSKFLQSLLTKFPTRLTLVPLDICCDDSVKAAASQMSKKFPEGIDFLINNAGIPSNDSTPMGILAAINTNTVGPYRVIQALMPEIRKGKKKVVLNVSSRAGSFSNQDAMRQFATLLGETGISYGYRMSKSALNFLTVVLAKDYAEEGITFTSVHPGIVTTDMFYNNLGENASLINNTITPTESAVAQLKILHNLTIKDSGKFFHYDGSIFPF